MTEERPAQGRTALGIVGWAAAAVVATGVGVAALSAIGAGITESVIRPLSQSEVEGRLAAATAAGDAADRGGLDTPPTSAVPSEGPAASESASPPPSGEPSSPDEDAAAPPDPERIDTVGGMVTARCGDADVVELVAQAPAQGFGVDVDVEDEGDDDEPLGAVTVQFESEELDVEVLLICSGGVLSHETSIDD
ncbi:hypothetical protein FHR81_001562 [Actinoalloteichus hoggarensis]|uniref:Uncharacterized protein n=1 Tax=Actinoalloteichus hoggarensis TaxID=1470176 RepID=A0A221W0K7_9PSEU|nr:hypothetical protein [Actinoalloteichus hoggarensis]ASO19294.1 hypothetical protein AHOG_08245 [Actinoalloteichus hoggarensis]MBB5920532.1 hypothetical protein [Actinoalloteichus hoggarensis]